MGSDQPGYLIRSIVEQLANIVEPDLTRIVLGVGSKDEDAVLLFDSEQAFPVNLSHLWFVFS